MLTSKQFANDPHNVIYRQVPQSNPILWSIYALREDELFEAQTGMFKCKDFFNDIVSAYNGGPQHPIYGFDVSKVKLAPYGIFVRLFNIQKGFYENIERVNDSLRQQLGIVLKPVPIEDVDGQCLMLLPRQLFNSTFIISKVTLWIRCCNTETVFSSLDEMLKTSVDNQYSPKSNSNLLVPEKFKEYWFFVNEDYNSKKPTNYMSIIHDCGYLQMGAAISARNKEFSYAL